LGTLSPLWFLAPPPRAGLTARLVLGYLAVWTLFGAVAYRADALVHAAVERIPFLTARTSLIAAAILLLAGVYQFTPLKHMCLEKCRSPYSFLVERWRAAAAASDALRLGWRHGLFCLGCCWTLMLLMFAIGGANLGWMLALGAVMAAERTTRWGRHLTRPLGLALMALGVLHVAGVVVLPVG
jgi:predicted metal-binding membrane protein